MNAHKTSCNECGWQGEMKDLLTAPNPFEEDDIIHGCPKCHSIDCFTQLCDVDGCKDYASSGWPSKVGYRHPCHIHAVKLDAATASTLPPSKPLHAWGQR
jgi:hypothetical protein